MILAAVLLPTTAPSTVAGLYQAQQMEVGAALELKKNGHFRYQLDYGAVSEHSEGDWTFDGKVVRLTTKPMPKSPSFELIRDDAAPLGELVITLESPGFGEEGYRLDAVGTNAESGKKGRVTAGEDGRVDSGGHKLSAVEPLVPVYGTIGGHFALSSDRGHHLLLRFHANDLGRAAFDREVFEVTPKGLILRRYDTEIRFVRVRP